jgi:hypothetical protein
MFTNDQTQLDWARRMAARPEAGPGLAAAKRAELADAARRGLMDRVTFVDIGWSGGLWPVVPRQADMEWTPSIAIQGDLTRRRR